MALYQLQGNETCYLWKSFVFTDVQIYIFL